MFIVPYVTCCGQSSCRRALELSFALINEGNVRVMVKEILVFLQTAEPEFKSYITANVISTAEKYFSCFVHLYMLLKGFPLIVYIRFAPDKRWHVDTVLNVLVSVSRNVLVSSLPTHTMLCRDLL